jgi:hypothetical protein
MTDWPLYLWWGTLGALLGVVTLPAHGAFGLLLSMLVGATSGMGLAHFLRMGPRRRR